MIPLRSDSDVLYQRSQLAILMTMDFSYTVASKERGRYEINLTHGVNDQGQHRGPVKKRGDYTVHPLNPYDSDIDQSKNVRNWNSNGDSGDGEVGPNFFHHQRFGGLRLLRTSLVVI